ncbi:MAG: diaminopimelate decarboxylase, partial [Bacteroidota bacterium]
MMEQGEAVFTIGGLSAESLALEFGTPLYVYDAATIVGQLNRLKSAFRTRTAIKFAVKALTNISVLRLLQREGAGADAVSIHEVRLALHAGFAPGVVMFTPNNVAFHEVEEAVSLGTEITLDNLPLLEKFGATYGGQYPVGIRLNPHIMAGGNLKISTGHVHSKFGISIQQQTEIQEIVEKYGMNISGLHIHTGSEITDLGVYRKMADILLEIATYFPGLRFVDFGGGFKVAYKPGDAVMDIPALGALLSDAVEEHNRKRQTDLELRIEPGKFLVSEAGFLLTRATVVKQTPSSTFVGVDSGLNHLIRPMMYDAWHEIENVSNPQGSLKTYTVAGNICETDNFGKDRQLKEVREGDLIVIKNAGAYGYTMSSNYNSRPRPAEVLIHEGKAKLIRR